MPYFMEGSPSNNFDAASIIPNVTPWTLLTVTPLLSPRRRFIYFNGNFKDGLFNLAKKIVSVLHEELERRRKSSITGSWRIYNRGSKANPNFQLVNKPSRISAHEVGRPD